MLITGTLYLPDGRLTPGHLRLDGDRITNVTLGDTAESPDLGGTETLVFPGFTDCHLHLPQFDSIGVDGLTLLEWLDRAIFPAEAKWADSAYAGAMTERVAERLLSHGTTGIAAYATVHHDASQTAINVLADRGMRAIVGQVLMDQNAPDELLRPADRLLDEAARLQGRDRVEPSINPRFAVSCSSELLRGAGELARSTGATVQTHLSETHAECRLVSQLHDEPSYLEIYRNTGLLDGRSLLAHSIHLSEAEQRTLAGLPLAYAAHCPTANLFLQSGRMDIGSHRSAGINVALGSDIAGGPDVSMVRVARAMLETAKAEHAPSRDPSEVPGTTPYIPSPAACWAQITSGNADALGWSDSGRITTGAHADLVLVDPTTLRPEQRTDLSALLYNWDDRWITRTVANGRVAWSA